MKISGDMIGNDGNRMGNTQRFTKFFLGLLFSRSGVKQKETWIFQGQYKKKKDLMQHGKCVLHKVLNSYFFLGSQRMPNCAFFTGLEDAEISQKHLCPRVTSLILKRAISNILPQLPFYLFLSPLPVLLFLLIFSCFFLITSWHWAALHDK